MNECDCSSLSNPAVVEFAYQRPRRDFDTFSRYAKRGLPWWWLDACHCNACGQDWLVAQEERFNDVYILRRLSAEESDAVRATGTWPADFDRYEDLLRIGAEAGHGARYADHTELMPIVRDVLSDRPTMTADELACLVNVSDAQALHLLELASGQ